MVNGVPAEVGLGGPSLALGGFERDHFAAAGLGGVAGFMQVFALFTYLSGVHTFYGSVETPRPLTAVGLLCVVVAIVLRIGATPALRKARPLLQPAVTVRCAIIAPLLLVGAVPGVLITDAHFR